MHTVQPRASFCNRDFSSCLLEMDYKRWKSFLGCETHWSQHYELTTALLLISTLKACMSGKGRGKVSYTHTNTSKLLKAKASSTSIKQIHPGEWDLEQAWGGTQWVTALEQLLPDLAQHVVVFALVLHNETELNSTACKIQPSVPGSLHLSKQACHVEYH